MQANQLFGNNTDAQFVSFDEIQNAFKTKTQYQHYYEQPEPDSGTGYAPSDEFSPSLVNPDGEDLGAADNAPKIDHEHAMRTGERIAKIADTAIDFTLSNFVARNGESYKADERDLQDIAECWGEIAEERGWSLGPEWSLVILYIMVYGPLVKQAFTDRKLAELEERQQKLEQRMDTYEYHANTPTEEMPQDGNHSTGPTPTSTLSPFSNGSGI